MGRRVRRGRRGPDRHGRLDRARHRRTVDDEGGHPFGVSLWTSAEARSKKPWAGAHDAADARKILEERLRTSLVAAPDELAGTGPTPAAHRLVHRSAPFEDQRWQSSPCPDAVHTASSDGSPGGGDDGTNAGSSCIARHRSDGSRDGDQRVARRHPDDRLEPRAGDDPRPRRARRGGRGDRGRRGAASRDRRHDGDGCRRRDLDRPRPGHARCAGSGRDLGADEHDRRGGN